VDDEHGLWITHFTSSPDGRLLGMTPPNAQDAYVRNTDDLCRLWSSLIGPDGFSRHTLWMIFLDEAGRVSPVLVPIDDIPRRPEPQMLSSFRTVVSGLLGQDGIDAVALLLSRPGGSAMTANDRAWARSLVPLAPRWPVALGTAGSVRVFAPDDLIGD
jgi:hypothetical protein